MMLTYTPEHLYEAEKSFAAHYGLPVDALKHVHQWRLETAAQLPSDWHRIAVWVATPVLTGFARWLTLQIGRHKNAACLAVMRDGWLPGRLLRDLYDIPVKELWLNRDLSMRAAFGCGDDEALLNWLARTRLRPLSRRKATEQLADLPYAGPEPHQALDIESARILVEDWKGQNLLPQIRNRAGTLAERFMQHWRKCVGPSNDVLLIDFACVGNAQRALQTILMACHDRKSVSGYNFVTTSGTKWAKQAGCSLRGFLAEDGAPSWFADLYARTPELIEIFAAVPCGPLLDYAEDGEPLCGNTFLKSEQCKMIEDVQLSILKAAASYRKQAESSMNEDVLRCLWGRLLLEPLPLEVGALQNWPLDDGLDGSNQRVLAAACDGVSEQWTKTQSAWPSGSMLRGAAANPVHVSSR